MSSHSLAGSSRPPLSPAPESSVFRDPLGRLLGSELGRFRVDSGRGAFGEASRPKEPPTDAGVPPGPSEQGAWRTAAPTAAASGFSVVHFKTQVWTAREGMGQEYRVVLQLQPAPAAKIRNANLLAPRTLQPGEVVIVDANARLPGEWLVSGEFVLVSLTSSFVRWAANELVQNAGPIQLRHLEVVDDPVLRGLMLGLWSDSTDAHHQARTYGETLASALAAHLVRHYSMTTVATRVESVARNGERSLGRRELKTCLEYIEANLARKIVLKELAAQVGLTENHFGVRFRLSTGQTPHQYVLYRRVDRARERLVNSQEPIAQIAADLGFCDQGNLTLHFRQIMGVTPMAFRKGKGRPGTDLAR